MEIPHDWGTTKRPVHVASTSTTTTTTTTTTSTTSAGADAEEPVAQPPTTKKRKADVEGEAGVERASLGPRGVFNAITHDNPEKGQLKQMVMEQLRKPCSVAESHQREMEVHCLLSKLPYQKMLSDLFINQVPLYALYALCIIICFI